jgi:site-specific recombinase XerD
MSFEVTDEMIAGLSPETQVIVRALLARIEELETQLNKTSKNSSKPPSASHPHARYPKMDEKPPFQTRAESERDQEVLWECLYLRVDEIDQVLNEVQIANLSTFLYPMLVLAAHTGARRSELLRSQIQDVNFDGGTLTLRERKRDKTLNVRHDAFRCRIEFVRQLRAGWMANAPGQLLAMDNNQ